MSGNTVLKAIGSTQQPEIITQARVYNITIVPPDPEKLGGSHSIQ